MDSKSVLKPGGLRDIYWTLISRPTIGFRTPHQAHRNPLASEWQRAVDRYADMGSGSSGLAAVHGRFGENAELGEFGLDGHGL